MFVRSVVIVTFNVKWVTVNDLNDILYDALCTEIGYLL